MSQENEMAEEAQVKERQVLSEREAADFKQYYGQVVNGIMSSIPFGVNIDPNAVAVAARNTAMAMLDTVKDFMPEEPEHQRNFPAPVPEKITLLVLLAELIRKDRGVAADTLAVFGVADVNKLDTRDYLAFYHLAKRRLEA